MQYYKSQEHWIISRTVVGNGTNKLKDLMQNLEILKSFESKLKAWHDRGEYPKVFIACNLIGEYLLCLNPHNMEARQLKNMSEPLMEIFIDKIPSAKC